MELMTRMSRIVKIMALISFLLVIGHGAMAANKIKLVASFSILADIADAIGGEQVEIESLVGPNEDAHAFDPNPAQVAHIANADLIIINGLGFEGWLERLMTSSSALPKIVVASDGIAPLHADEANTANLQHATNLDPHAWQDVANVRIYAKNIAHALAIVDPAHRAIYDANLARYDETLQKLDAEIRSAIATIPYARRKLVTTHDAFGYFEKAYGLEMIAPLGVAPEAQPSAKDIARIIRQIRTDAVPAIFLETMIDPRLAEQISSESGAKIGGNLYSDALSAKNGPAGSYIAMMETNIRELTRALAP
jgi:zinc/manganese transport system substrate-binding protein